MLSTKLLNKSVFVCKVPPAAAAAASSSQWDCSEFSCGCCTASVCVSDGAHRLTVWPQIDRLCDSASYI